MRCDVRGDPSRQAKASRSQIQLSRIEISLRKTIRIYHAAAAAAPGKEWPTYVPVSDLIRQIAAFYYPQGGTLGGETEKSHQNEFSIRNLIDIFIKSKSAWIHIRDDLKRLYLIDWEDIDAAVSVGRAGWATVLLLFASIDVGVCLLLFPNCMLM